MHEICFQKVKNITLLRKKTHFFTIFRDIKKFKKDELWDLFIWILKHIFDKKIMF